MVRNNLCTPFKHDIRCASLCGVEFVVTKKRTEKRAQRESCLKGVQRLKLIKRHRDRELSHHGGLIPLMFDFSTTQNESGVSLLRLACYVFSVEINSAQVTQFGTSAYFIRFYFGTDVTRPKHPVLINV